VEVYVPGRTAMRLLALGVAIGLFVGAPAYAQDTEAASGAEISGADLTSKQKMEFALETVDQLDTAKTQVLQMIEDAQKNKDVILLNCLNERLGLLKGLHKVAVDAKDGLAEAIARENVDLEEHNFRKAYIARDQGVTVAAEAEACIGQVGTSFPGKTRVIPKYDGPGEADSDFGAAAGGNTRPPDASPLD
jgi:hypothetical protein